MFDQPEGYGPTKEEAEAAEKAVNLLFLRGKIIDAINRCDDVDKLRQISLEFGLLTREYKAVSPDYHIEYSPTDEDLRILELWDENYKADLQEIQNNEGDLVDNS